MQKTFDFWAPPCVIKRLQSARRQELPQLLPSLISGHCNYQAGKFAIMDAAWQNTIGLRRIPRPMAKQNFTSAVPSR
ncbi:hypothetical protein CCGE531_12910 [Rhizobium sp. CCGE531]|nr:hypothetical protein CCGE531_12910 [Rhizobium sp. CCGE531]AYG73181.1 hypothetical protein CCGE532_12330 [Rhizobium sp. CCGE532]